MAWFLISNTTANLEERRIASGFGFLDREAGFEIGESAFLRYGAADSYLRALFVGLSNTLLVAAIGIVLATILGTFDRPFRLSKNFLLRTLSRGLRRVHPQRAAPGAALLLVRGDHRGAAGRARGAVAAAGRVPVNRGIFFPSLSSVPVLRGLQLRRRLRDDARSSRRCCSGLAIYTAAFIAEIVRAGILAVAAGQMRGRAWRSA